MKFKFAPKGNYHIGQTIRVDGKDWVVESYSHTGRNLVATRCDTKFERILVILTDAKPIEEVST